MKMHASSPWRFTFTFYFLLRSPFEAITMIILVFLCVSIINFTSVFSDSKSSLEYVPCDRGWYYFRDKCYRAGGRKESERLTWTRALDRCKNYGADLVSIGSKEEQDFIVAFLLLDIQWSSWTGLNDRIEEDNFRWTDGSVYNYSNWNTNEPSTHGKKGQIHVEDCVELRLYPEREEVGQWNDLSCEIKQSYICEKNTNPRKSSPNLVYCSPEEGGGWKYRTSCYHVVTEMKSWQEAERHCKNTYNGHLLTIRDKLEDYFLEFAIPDIRKEMWIGIKTKNQLQQKWTSGWYVSYDGFNKNEKAFIGGACVARKMRKEWATIPCSRQLPFICEVTKETPPVLKVPPTGAHCPNELDDWRDLGGYYCYYINTTTDVNYFEARFECNRRGGDLVSLHSQEESDILLPFVKFTKYVFYIGLMRLYANYEDTFAWLDGSNLDYQNWGHGEPDREDEKCVVVLGSAMTWHDYPCNPVHTSGYICSIKKVLPYASDDENTACKSFCIAPSSYLFGIISQCPDAQPIS